MTLLIVNLTLNGWKMRLHAGVRFSSYVTYCFRAFLGEASGWITEGRECACLSCIDIEDRDRLIAMQVFQVHDGLPA